MRWVTSSQIAILTRYRFLPALVSSSARSFSSSPGEEVLQTYVKNDVGYIVWNRPKALNATSLDVFQETAKQLGKFNSEPAIKAIVLTGKGKFFTSGNDVVVNSSLWLNKKSRSEEEEGAKHFVHNFINPLASQIIDLNKVLIVAPNGPSVGIGATILGLADMVLASESAYFWTPFGAIGISPEFCSSYTFPKILGRSLATEVLLFGRKLSAQEAKTVGLVSTVISESDFTSQVEGIVTKWINETKNNSLQTFRQITFPPEERAKLHAVKTFEGEKLWQNFLGPEALEETKKFIARKAKA